MPSGRAAKPAAAALDDARQRMIEVVRRMGRPALVCMACGEAGTLLRSIAGQKARVIKRASGNGQLLAGPTKSHRSRSSCAKWGSRPGDTCGPMQDMLLELLLGANAAAALAHRLDALRVPPNSEHNQPALSSPGVGHFDAERLRPALAPASLIAPDAGPLPHEQACSVASQAPGAAAEARPAFHADEEGTPRSAPTTVAEPASGEEAAPDPFVQASRAAARARGRGRRGGTTWSRHCKASTDP